MTVPHFVAAVALWCLPCAAMAGPRDELLHLVPDDYTFCLVAQNLRGEGKSDGKSPFLKGLSESALLKGFQNAPEAKKLQAALEAILHELGVTREQLLNDILGDAVVFAYRKGPAGKQAEEDGLLLVHAREGHLLKRVVDRVNELQTKGGELKEVEAVSGRDGQYFRRIKAMDSEPADYYAIRDNRLVFSGSESLLLATLSRMGKPDPGEPAIARRMKQLGVNESPVAFLISPRSFDTELVDNTKGARASEQAFLKEFAAYWKAVDALALFVNFSPSLEVGLAVHVQKHDLPPAAVKFFAEAGKRSPLWDRVPDDALFALVGRLHFESMAEMLGAFLTGEDRQKVRDGLTKVARTFLKPADLGPLARGFGPDVGFWVTPPDERDGTWCPQAVLAVKVAEGPEGQKAEQAALKGLDFLARLAGLSDNQLEVFEEKQGDLAVTGLTSAGLFPPKFRPCFASKGGYILVAGAPETIARFAPPTGPATEASDVPILRLSASGWRQYLKTHRQGLVGYLAAANRADPKELSAQIDLLLPLFEGLERVEVLQRMGPDRLSLVLRLTEKRK